MSYKRKKKTKTEWLTDELLEQIKSKDTLLMKAKKNRINERTGNVLDYKFWRTIKQVIPGRTQNKEIILKDSMTNHIIPKLQTADFINNLFVKVGLNLAKDCQRPWNPVGIPQHTTYNIGKVTW